MLRWAEPSNRFTWLKDEKMQILKLLVKTSCLEYLLDNHQLKDLPSVLLYLKERPEEQPDAYFKEDIYISPKFN